MNAFTPPRDFSGKPDRAHDVITIIGRANQAIGSALVLDTRRPSRELSRRMFDVVKAIQFLPMYLDGMVAIDLDSALSDASNAFAALDAAVVRDRRTIAGRVAQWRHIRRHPEQYTIFPATPSGKGVSFVIPEVLPPNTVHHIHDRKATPNTLP
jgi:hypothetical protein